jgi:hypothetical protein
MRRPFVIVEGAQEEAAPLLRVLEATGWRLHPGFRLPMDDWVVGGVVCFGTVASQSDAALAVLSAVRGAGLVAAVGGRDDVLDRLVEDVRRLGRIDFWPKSDGSPLDELTLEQWCLLVLLANGRTLADAAQILHCSRRSADRKLAMAREALAVSTTAEAVLIVEAARIDGVRLTA